MAKEWFIRVAGKELGPMSPQELKGYVKQGMIRRETAVRFSATGKWSTAGRIKGLFPPLPATEDVNTARGDSDPLEAIAADVYSTPSQSSSSLSDSNGEPAGDTAPAEDVNSHPLQGYPPARGDGESSAPWYASATAKPSIVRVRPGWLVLLVRALDLKFERYLTPQIIRVLWVLALVLGICGWGYVLLSRFSMALPGTHTAMQERPASVQRKLDLLDRLIAAKAPKTREDFSHNKDEFETPSNRKTSSPAPRTSEDESVSAYFRMTLDQLLAERRALEEQNPIARSVVSFRGLLSYAMLAAIATVSTLIGILLCRVGCEVLIVIFNIAKSLVRIHEAIIERASLAISPADVVADSGADLEQDAVGVGSVQ